MITESVSSQPENKPKNFVVKVSPHFRIHLLRVHQMGRINGDSRQFGQIALWGNCSCENEMANYVLGITTFKEKSDSIFWFGLYEFVETGEHLFRTLMIF
jgi:hypothetical protein